MIVIPGGQKKNDNFDTNFWKILEFQINIKYRIALIYIYYGVNRIQDFDI